MSSSISSRRTRRRRRRRTIVAPVIAVAVIVVLLSFHQPLSLVDAWSISTTTRTSSSVLPWTESTGSSSSSRSNSKRPTLTRRNAVQIEADIDIGIEDETDDAVEARSAFGTKQYWDDVYAGRGDFPADEYTWYYGYDVFKRHISQHLNKRDNILVPGIGNDPLLLDLLADGYTRITAQDYSEHAIERQDDLLWYHSGDTSGVTLHQSDVRRLPTEWNTKYDVIIEKGLLDAVYLSGEGQVEQAVESLMGTLKPGGIFVSVSGVVPDNLRRLMFNDDDNDNSASDEDCWTWLRDGTNDLQAGCFIFQKNKIKN